MSAPDNSQAAEISISLVGDGMTRIYYGTDRSGRYVTVPYKDIKDYVVSKRPRKELLDLYPELKEAE